VSIQFHHILTVFQYKAAIFSHHTEEYRLPGILLGQAVGIPVAALLVVAVELVPDDLMVVEGDEGEALLQLKR
jgi:hypothetical protein